MSVYFIGCLHLGHKWMHVHRGFNDIYNHDEHLIHSWNQIINKKDIVYILGDLTMETNKFYPYLDRLKGIKRVVGGNHDLPKHSKELMNYVESISGMIDYKGFVLTHAPIHPSDISMCRGNIHAHIHENKLEEVFAFDRYKDSDSVIKSTLHKYYNVDAHMIDYKPKTIDELISVNNGTKKNI
jgi:calcineurin-like phosphoesterase family protein